MQRKPLTRDDAKRVLEVIDAGLVQGLGIPEPGKMCIEAAVSFALNLPFNDNPWCVAQCIRRFKMRINDAPWSSNEARAKGMRRAGLAQLGSQDIDQKLWRKLVAEKIVRRIFPICLRSVVTKATPEGQDALEAAAKRCEAEGSFASAHSARKVLTHFFPAYADAYTYADAYAYAYAYAYADADADAYADAYAYAFAYADGEPSTKAQRRDELLSLAAEICVEACIECGTQGSQWLDLAAA